MASTDDIVFRNMPEQPYAVWAFVLGNISGPRRMTVRVEGKGYVGILEDENVFPLSTHVTSIGVAVNDKLFRVYFDRKLHKAEDENNIYVVIRLRSDAEAISIDINEDMPDIVDVFGW